VRTTAVVAFGVVLSLGVKDQQTEIQVRSISS